MLPPISVPPENLKQRTVFIGKADNETFPIFRRPRCKRKHMPRDDIGFDVIQIKITFGIAKCRAGMSEAMQLVLVPVAFYMPIV